jgi:hypothetical protein
MSLLEIEGLCKSFGGLSAKGPHPDGTQEAGVSQSSGSGHRYIVIIRIDS